MAPYGAELIPVEDNGCRGERILSLMAWYASLTLAGATLPASSLMLASDTPAHGTLRASWIMSFSALGNAVFCCLRQLAPFIAGGTFVGSANVVPPVTTRIAFAAPFAFLVAANSCVMGVSITASVRPLSSITVMDNQFFTRNATANTHVVSMFGETIMKQHPLPGYGDVERDAMIIIAIIASAAVWAWVLCCIIVTFPDHYAKGAQRRKLVAVVATIACAAQVTKGFSSRL